MEWFLVWLILNALFFVWRILVTTEVEARDQSSAEKVLDNVEAYGVGRGHKSRNARQSPAPNEGVSDIGDLSLCPPTVHESAGLSLDLGCLLSARCHRGTSVVRPHRGASVVRNSRGPCQPLGMRVCLFPS